MFMGKFIITESEKNYIKSLYSKFLFEQESNDGRLRIDFGADFQQGKYDVKSLNVNDVYKKLEPLKKFYTDNDGGDIKLYIESSESNSTPPPGMKDGDLSKNRLQTIKSVITTWLNTSIPNWNENSQIEEYIVKPEERQEKYVKGVDKATDPKYLADQYVYLEVGVDNALKPLQTKTRTLPNKGGRGFDYVPQGNKISNFGGDILRLDCNSSYEVTGGGVEVGKPPFIGFDRKIDVSEYNKNLEIYFNSLRIPDRFIITNAESNTVLLDTGYMGSPNWVEFVQFVNLAQKYQNQNAFNGVNVGDIRINQDYGQQLQGSLRNLLNAKNPKTIKFDNNTSDDHEIGFNISNLSGVKTVRLVAYSPLKNTLFKLKLSCPSK